jgi:hypothetical protein
MKNENGMKRLRIPWRTRCTVSDGTEYWMFAIPHWWDRRVGWLFRIYHGGWIRWERGKGWRCGWGKPPDDGDLE